MLLSTTQTIQGKEIKEYRGIVFGESVEPSRMFFKDFKSAFNVSYSEITAHYENRLVDARASAINQMIERAQNIGANAIVGVSVDYETLGENGSMLMIVATGTAVII